MNRLREIKINGEIQHKIIQRCLGYSHIQSINNLLCREDVTDYILHKFCSEYIMHLKSQIAAMKLVLDDIKKNPKKNGRKPNGNRS